MHFKIEGGEMYIYNIYILNLLNGAMMIIYIYVCDEKSEDHKNLRIFTHSVFKIKR